MPILVFRDMGAQSRDNILLEMLTLTLENKVKVTGHGVTKNIGLIDLH